MTDGCHRGPNKRDSGADRLMVPHMGMAWVQPHPERGDYRRVLHRQLYARLDHPRMVQGAVMIVREERIGNCRAPNCDAAAYCKGYCDRHYRRFKAYGDPMAGKTPKGDPIRFLQSIPATDACVEWPYQVGTEGYGQIRFDGKMMNAHRASLIIHGGQAEPKEMHAAHAPKTCHNRLCVNPRHLRWATPKSNMHDRVLDGTMHGPKGELHGAAILNEQSVIAIRESRQSQKALAEVYGVSKQTISKIIRRERLSHV